MINNLLAYSGIVTKTKAMGKWLITLEDYEKISNLPTVADFVVFLKNQSGYKELFANCDEHSLHRNQVEHMLINSLYLDYSKLFRFANDNQRNLLNFLFFRYEVNILKSCLQQVFDSNSTYDLASFEPFFAKHSDLNLKQLSEAKNLDEFILNLKGTEYFALFQKISKVDAVSTLYDYETQLDIYYYTKVWKLCKNQLKGTEQKAMKDTIGKQIDLLNMMWIYRSKKYYNVESAKIYSSIIPICYKLTHKDLHRMVEASSIEEFLAILKASPYVPKGMDLHQTSIEFIYRQILNKAYNDNRHRNPTSMSTLFYYLHLKEQEINRLTIALECIRYSLNPSETLKYILE